MPRPDPGRVRAALDAQLAALGSPAYAGASDEPEALCRACVDAVVAAYDAGETPRPAALKVAVRFLLDRLAVAAPGRSVEVRVPPYAAVQCVAGPRHTRGTPPGVAETDPATWIALATGRVGWAEAVAGGKVMASGERTDLSALLPVR